MGTGHTHATHSVIRNHFVVLATLLATIGVIYALEVGAHERAPLASSETRFVEYSQNGMQIVPASCPSDPHYSGECSSYSQASYYSQGTYYTQASYSGGGGSGTGGTLPPVTGLSSACNASATQITLSWNALSGADGYIVALNDPSNDGGSGCIGSGGWYCAQSADRPWTELITTTSHTFSITPNKYYLWWVSPHDSSGYSQSSGGTFSCSFMMSVVPFTADDGAGRTFEASGHIQARPALVKNGARSRVYWNVINADACTVTGSNGDSWTGLFSGVSGKETGLITEQTTYTLSCQSLPNAFPPTLTETAIVNVLPQFEEQ